jgi:hypothetical protein
MAKCPNVKGAQLANDLGAADSTIEGQRHSIILPCNGLSALRHFGHL